jgi:hypothetical protein
MLRGHNLVRRTALALIRRIGPNSHAWSKDLFEQARRRIETLYPTTVKLWRAGRETVRAGTR